MKSEINESPDTPETIDALISSLSSDDATERNIAQGRLMAIGEEAVPALVRVTAQPDVGLRREAAQILGDLRTPSAVPTLIGLLVDDAFEVRWRAAEGLVKMKHECVVPLFRELLRAERFGSVWFLEGVHHILRKLDEQGYLGPSSQRVLRAFADPVIEISVPEAAERALEELTHLT